MGITYSEDITLKTRGSRWESLQTGENHSLAGQTQQQSSELEQETGAGQKEGCNRGDRVEDRITAEASSD